MKRQVLVIHGGTAFDTYDEYISYLKNSTVTLESLNSKGWKRSLATVLGEEYLVLTPQMPNAFNARYVEWKIWFEKIVDVLDESVILVGHSLGGIFLTKYLSENIFPKKIIATMLVAAPYNTKTKHPPVDFVIDENLLKFKEQGGPIHIFHSKDDQIVPYSNFEDYQNALPDAGVHVFEDRGHFLGETFPELVEEIKGAGYGFV